ncbi:hypothetical protein SAMN02990966_06862 [Rhodospirillales bacterium URHD0017]|nr:hypothetical protein SAMN02990966_06862 [Rhodospirillales bacterium URHD0017]
MVSSADRQTLLVRRLIGTAVEAIGALPTAAHAGALQRAGQAYRRLLAREWPHLPASELQRLERAFVEVVGERVGSAQQGTGGQP